ncbi:saccharopine dehydrogenase-like oxidoreductase isoform X4 [Anguilla anguilla]|uniref:saccharopine dehydrogenase-like oxidoreductase isoform X4 n=1 Tax=Anguilla anguilla TaxID=7936 RepID=UPI0015AF867B|nr:saccharopine dehydrogenase-like oxidoreductase isoform X4 [Anguilla anguilla]
MTSTANSRPYHVIVFGASGFTGQFVVEEVTRTLSDGPKGTMKWAIAGRSRQKLEKVLEQASATLTKPELMSEVGIILADVGDLASLATMCKQGVVVLNCVGPFLEGMQLKYQSQAAENGVYVIGSCGFDSIPADMGIQFTRDHFKGTLTAVESFLTISTGPEGGCIHDGTWQSAVYGFADSDKLRALRKKAGYKPLPVVGKKIKRRSTLFFSKEIEQYAVPFMGADPSVVKRTQRFLHKEYQESPVQYGAYVGVGGISSLVKLFFAGILFCFMVKFAFGRKLLIKFPEFFSFGVFSKVGPTRKQMEDSSFCFTFLGEGYTEGQDPTKGKPNAKIRTQVKGPDAGYVATPIAMVQAALTLLSEPESLPKMRSVEEKKRIKELGPDRPILQIQQQASDRGRAYTRNGLLL